jgi:hypothetical protein
MILVDLVWDGMKSSTGTDSLNWQRGLLSPRYYCKRRQIMAVQDQTCLGLGLERHGPGVEKAGTSESGDRPWSRVR